MFYYFPGITKFHGHWSSNRKVTWGGGGGSFRPQIISPTPSKHISTTIPKIKESTTYQPTVPATTIHSLENALVLCCDNICDCLNGTMKIAA